MAVKIRLRQQGRTNHQVYRMVVTDSRYPRDGRYVEAIGWYDPNQEKDNLRLDAERIVHWVGQGATLSPTVEALVARGAPSVLKSLKDKEHERRQKRLNKAKAQKAKA